MEDGDLRKLPLRTFHEEQTNFTATAFLTNYPKMNVVANENFVPAWRSFKTGS